MAKMTKEEHTQRHKDFHKFLDEMVADFITHTGRLPSATSLMLFMQWSHEQTKNPTEKK